MIYGFAMSILAICKFTMIISESDQPTYQKYHKISIENWATFHKVGWKYQERVLIREGAFITENTVITFFKICTKYKN